MWSVLGGRTQRSAEQRRAPHTFPGHTTGHGRHRTGQRRTNARRRRPTKDGVTASAPEQANSARTTSLQRTVAKQSAMLSRTLKAARVARASSTDTSVRIASSLAASKSAPDFRNADKHVHHRRTDRATRRCARRSVDSGSSSGGGDEGSHCSHRRLVSDGQRVLSHGFTDSTPVVEKFPRRRHHQIHGPSQFRFLLQFSSIFRCASRVVSRCW